MQQPYWRGNRPIQGGYYGMTEFVDWRTLWVCNISGGPFQFTATKPGKTSLGLEEAHRDLQISPAEFDEVAAELGRTLDFFKVPKPEKAEVLAAFAAHKNEVTAGYVAGAKRG